MTIQSGVIEEIKVQEKSDGSEVLTNKFGLIQTADHNVVQNVESRGSVGQGAVPQANIDRVAQIDGSLTCNPSNLQILEIFGTFTDNGDGTYTVTPDDTLPDYTFKQQFVDGGGTVTLDSFKFGSYTLSAEEEGDLTLELAGQGLSFQADDSETISTEAPDTNIRRFFDAEVSIDGSTVGSVESFTVEFTRNLESVKGIEDDAAGEKREPTAVLEKLFEINYDIIINIEDLRAYEEATGDSSSPYNIQDDRSDVDITITIDTSAGTDDFKLLNTRPTEVSAEQNNEGEKLTATLSGNARDWQVDGDL